jgi:lipopolysaccharide/colanic/teichoic acid biosynthesis glycosyltransferase
MAVESVRRRPAPFSRAAKRTLDIVFAAAGFVLLAPVFLLAAAAIAVSLGRPVLFSQQRVGRHGRLFRFYKFRTLPLEALARADRQWCVEAPNRLMAFLRRSGLDELPQLLNVLRGEMSLVGPRPERPYFADKFERRWPSYSRRHEVRPGITGWAQVNGWRGDTSILRRLECDLHYLNHWSLRYDLKVLLLTVTGFARSLGELGRHSSGGG